jgi:hypothetical protein
MAAPNPCTARATISIAELGASAQASDARVKIAKPPTNTRLAPMRSPSAGRENDCGKSDRVSVHNPLQCRYSTADCAADAVDSSIDNRDVELDHAVAQAHGRKSSDFCTLGGYDLSSFHLHLSLPFREARPLSVCFFFDGLWRCPTSSEVKQVENDLSLLRLASRVPPNRCPSSARNFSRPKVLHERWTIFNHPSGMGLSPVLNEPDRSIDEQLALGKVF